MQSTLEPGQTGIEQRLLCALDVDLQQVDSLLGGKQIDQRLGPHSRDDHAVVGDATERRIPAHGELCRARGWSDYGLDDLSRDSVSLEVVLCELRVLWHGLYSDNHRVSELTREPETGGADVRPQVDDVPGPNLEGHAIRLNHPDLCDRAAEPGVHGFAQRSRARTYPGHSM